MSKKNKTIILMAASALTALAGNALSQDTSTSNELAALFECQSKTDDAARLLCFDTTVTALQSVKIDVQQTDRAEARVTLSQDQVETLEKDAFGFNLPSLIQMRQLFKLDKADGAASDARSEDTDPKPLDRITLQVDRWEKTNLGRYRFYLTNGQVWTQTETVTLPRPREGDNGVVEVEIRKASLGSFLLQVNGKGRAVRVRRNR